MERKPLIIIYILLAIIIISQVVILTRIIRFQEDFTLTANFISYRIDRITGEIYEVQRMIEE